MKKLILLWLILIGCNSNQSTNSVDMDLVEKRIFQHADIVDGMGLLNDIVIEILEQYDSVSFIARRAFTNPIFNKKERWTNKYIFNSSLDSIIDTDTMKLEYESAGEWVEDTSLNEYFD